MSAPSEGRYALLVATARYSDSKLQQLRAPAADADRLAAVLRDATKGNFEVEVLLDESHGKLTRRIAGFFRDRRPDDLLLLHFSCHGVKDDRGELYLATTDTEMDLLSATGVSAAWLNDQISRTRSRRTVVLLDCCFSGSFPFGMRARAGDTVNAPEQFEGRGRAIITASSGLEYAYEGDQLRGEGQPSVFTEAVVEGLETGKADLDHDQRISVDDLYGYVYDRVKGRTPSQTPNKKSEIEGPLYLARSSYRPVVEPATLDPELLARTEDRYAGIRVGAVNELKALLVSSDPAPALAARQVLSRMTDDDSRQVSESAHAALATGDDANETPDEGEQSPEDRIASPSVERAPSRSPPRHAPRADAAARMPGSGAGFARRHWRPIGIVALAACALAVAVIIGTAGGGRGGGGSHPVSPAADYQALTKLLPAGIRPHCTNDPGYQSMTQFGARAQAHCEIPDDDLTYGLWRSPGQARDWLATLAPRAPKERACSKRTAAEMHKIIPRATTVCVDNVKGDGPGVRIVWNKTGSALAGVFLLSANHDQQTAVKRWRLWARAT